MLSFFMLEIRKMLFHPPPVAVPLPLIGELGLGFAVDDGECRNVVDAGLRRL